MDSVDNENRSAGAVLDQLVVGDVHRPIVLILESHSAQVRALHLAHRLEPRLFCLALWGPSPDKT